VSEGIIDVDMNGGDMGIGTGYETMPFALADVDRVVEELEAKKEPAPGHAWVYGFRIRRNRPMDRWKIASLKPADGVTLFKVGGEAIFELLDEQGYVKAERVFYLMRRRKGES
jgi:hypothetical protein